MAAYFLPWMCWFPLLCIYNMMTSPNGTFSALLALCEGNSPVTDEFPAQRLVTRSFDVFCDLRLNKRLSKQSWGWWFETPSGSLWRHCNEGSYLTLPGPAEDLASSCYAICNHNLDYDVILIVNDFQYSCAAQKTFIQNDRSLCYKNDE